MVNIFKAPPRYGTERRVILWSSDRQSTLQAFEKDWRLPDARRGAHTFGWIRDLDKRDGSPPHARAPPRPTSCHVRAGGELRPAADYQVRHRRRL
jgi:hypothetical protein